MSSTTIETAAELLLAVRAGGAPLSSLPVAPADLREAYAIMDRVNATLGPIGGWKTAPSRNGVKFNWAPIPAAGVYRDGDTIPLADLPRGEVELEVGILVATDLPPRPTPYSRDEVVAALGDVRVCLEIFSSRYADRAARSPLEIVADGQSALALVIGSGLSDKSAIDLESTELVLDYAGETHRKSGGRSLDDILDACTDLANGTFYLGGLKAGQAIITGARIGPIPLAATGPVAGRISPIGAVAISLT